jgi:hypothetical protein
MRYLTWKDGSIEAIGPLGRVIVKSDIDAEVQVLLPGSQHRAWTVDASFEEASRSLFVAKLSAALNQLGVPADFPQLVASLDDAEYYFQVKDVAFGDTPAGSGVMHRYTNGVEAVAAAAFGTQHPSVMYLGRSVSSLPADFGWKGKDAATAFKRCFWAIYQARAS